MAEPIPKDVLIRARFAMKRRIAAMVLLAMADDDAEFANIDRRCDWKAGTARNWLNTMIDGTANDFNGVSDFCLALGREMDFQMPRPSPAPSLPETPTE